MLEFFLLKIELAWFSKHFRLTSKQQFINVFPNNLSTFPFSPYASYLGWEIFHQQFINYLSVFFLSFPNRLGGFLLIKLFNSVNFFLLLPIEVKRFSIALISQFFLNVPLKARRLLLNEHSLLGCFEINVVGVKDWHFFIYIHSDPS